MKNQISALIFTLLFPVLIFGQSSGLYDLSHNVIAGGGEKSAGSLYKVEGTIAQPVAGTVSSGTNASTNTQYALRGGFWAFEQLAPTAATVSVSGKISSQDAEIMRRARVVLIDSFTGAFHTAQVNGLGYYRFEDLEVGRVYIVRAESPGFAFAPENYVFVLFDERDDVNFVGERVQ